MKGNYYTKFYIIFNRILNDYQNINLLVDQTKSNAVNSIGHDRIENFCFRLGLVDMNL
jgi:hypothetical protein